MANRTIITPVLRFWGFERHPFDDLVLQGDDLSLFVDRVPEMRRLQNALSRLCYGVFGARALASVLLLEAESSGNAKKDIYFVKNLDLK